METSLHKQLKALYAPRATQREIWVDDYRVDARRGKLLIEIQQGPLYALKKKLGHLLEHHRVLVVKPLAANRLLVRRSRAGGPVLSQRASPRHDTVHSIFSDLVHWTGLFPHPHLTLEVLLTEQVEDRVPLARPRRRKTHRVVDRQLVNVRETHRFQTAADLRELLPAGLEHTFTSADLARQLGEPIWLAQKMAYCLKHAGAIRATGKRRHAILYETLPDADRAAA